MVGSVIASSGFWTYILARRTKTSSISRLLMGLAHDRILFLGTEYIKRGSVTREEYEDLHKYLYEPYIEMGGNGTAERIMRDVGNLPIRFHRTFIRYELEDRNEQETQDGDA